jgi:cholesterol 7-dehydrogenase
MIPVPTSAQVKKWPSHEVNGFVFFWYHAETDKSLEPEWTVPELDVISSGQWKYRGRTEYKVNVHIQEIPENGADVAHLAHLHGPSMLGGSDLTFIDKSNCPGKLNGTSAPILHHHWEVGWQGPEHGAADCHIAVTTIKHDLRLFGRIPFILMEVEAKQIGPGLVYLTLGTSLGRCVLVQTVTPIAPFTQRVLHRLYASPTVIAPYAKLILWGEAIQVFIHQMVLVNFITFN